MTRFKFRVSSFELVRVAACGLAALALCAAPALAVPPQPMEQEELYTLPERAESVHPRLATLMAEALDEPTQLEKIKALSEIARYRMVELTDRVVELLGDESAIVRTSALLALDALDQPRTAEHVVRFAGPREAWDADTTEQAQLADQMLARWKVEPAIELWSARLFDRDQPVTLRISAARAIGAAGGWPEPLKATDILVDSGEAITLRLAVADALARAPAEAPEQAAGKLLESDPLLAARLLARAEEGGAVSLLKRLATDSSSAVQTVALGRLIELHPGHVLEFAADAIVSHDPNLRRIVVDALRHWQHDQAVDLLLATLNDEHPDVRNTAREALEQLAKNERLNGRMDAGLMQIIDGAIAEARAGTKQRWREAEQAAYLLGAIDHKPAAEKLTQLFDHPRLEVRVASVSGLRPLNVESTRQPVVALLKAVLDRLDERAKAPKAESQMFRGEQVDANLDDSVLLSAVAQTLGVWGVAEADPLLRRVIPKEAAAFSPARAAGVWALGMIHADKPDADLARQLILRVYDLNPNNPESNDVRLASIIAVGRMKAMTELKSVQGRLENDGLDIRAASRWAVMRMTGEELPEIVLEPAVRSDAFISPLR